MIETPYSKLFSSIVTSSIWQEDSDTRCVWITLLAVKNRFGEVSGSLPGLARIANVPLEKCCEAINKFMAPDQYSRTPDNEGRRILAIPGGWRVLNHAVYRAMMSSEDRKEYQRKWDQENRPTRKPDTKSDKIRQNPTNPTHAETDPDADADSVGIDIAQKKLNLSVKANEKKDRRVGRAPLFVRPNIAAVKFHALKLGLPELEADYFWSFYESNGWRVGRNPMRSWQAAMVNWRRNYQLGKYATRPPAPARDHENPDAWKL